MKSQRFTNHIASGGGWRLLRLFGACPSLPQNGVLLNAETALSGSATRRMANCLGDARPSPDKSKSGLCKLADGHTRFDRSSSRQTRRGSRRTARLLGWSLDG